MGRCLRAQVLPGHDGAVDDERQHDAPTETLTETGTGAAELSPEEELLWRSLGRITQLLPRRLEEDMVRAVGLTMSEFGVLQSLSEAPDGRLRMSELAEGTALSPSRMTRLADELAGRGWLRKERDASDARGTVAHLTAEGERQRRLARPEQLRSARRRVLDQVPPGAVAEIGAVLQRIVEQSATRS